MLDPNFDAQSAARTWSIKPVAWLSLSIWIAVVCGGRWIAPITGALMFASNAISYVYNVQLQLKLALILLAGINMAAFHSSAHRKIVERDELHLPLPGHAPRAHGELSHKACNCGHGGVRPLAVFANRVAASAIKSTPTGVRR